MSNVIVLDGCDYTFDIYTVVVIGVCEHVKYIASIDVKFSSVMCLWTFPLYNAVVMDVCEHVLSIVSRYIKCSSNWCMWTCHIYC